MDSQERSFRIGYPNISNIRNASLTILKNTNQGDILTIHETNWVVLEINHKDNSITLQTVMAGSIVVESFSFISLANKSKKVIKKTSAS